MTTTSSSSKRWRGMSGLLRERDRRVGEPVEVVEAPVDVAAEVHGRALVAERLPHQRVVVELDHGGRLDEFEVRVALDGGDRRELGVVVELEERRPRVERGDALRDRLG